MITFASPIAKQRHQQAGFVSVLTVVSVGMGLLVMMLMMYRNTLQSQDEQKHHLLRNDYQQREDAFLTALTNIIPNKAMRGMMDNTASDTSLSWESIFEEALTQANAHQAIDPAKAATLGLDSYRGANTANNTLLPADILKAVFEETGLISSGTNSSNLSYPDFLSCSSTLHSDSSSSPIVSHLKTYSDGSDFTLEAAPRLNFNYHEKSSIIAKHNWWTFKVAFSEQDITTTKLTRVNKQYLISLYEIPSQLAINSSSFTNFGQHKDGSAWAGISIEGGIFAESVKTKGTISTDHISSRKKIELTDASNPLASDNTARNTSLYDKDTSFDYSSSSDGGRVAFIPILPVVPMNLYEANSMTTHQDYINYDNHLTALAAGNTSSADYVNKLFYTRTLVDDGAGNLAPTQSMLGSNTISTGSTAWRYYSRGANQCDMILINDTFYYYDVDGVFTSVNKDSMVVASESVFTDGTEMTLKADHLITWLGAAISNNKSLCVNAGKNLVISNASDLSSFSNGFSLVTNGRLIIDGDVNNPTDNDGNVITASVIPLSLFAPETRYGSGLYTDIKINIEGRLGSLAENKDKDDAVEIGDLKVTGDVDADGNELVRSDDITANLQSITNLSDLPPINMVNWMIVVREIQP